MSNEILLSVKDLKQHFHAKGTVIKAVDGISFDVYKGETFGIVGESGCGKSTTGRSIIRLYTPTSGQVEFKGKDISKKKLSKFDRHELTRNIQMIFQDPMASLNPRMKVLDIIAEGLDIHKLYKTTEERNQKVYDILDIVGLNREHASRYPHEFSGGQRQRIGIARALIMRPELVIADEPISALDVSIQAQVVNLMKHLQKEMGLTYLFIAHDLSMVKFISDRIAVMYAGRIVELGTAEQIYDNPQHAYTKSLLSAIPLPNPEYERTRVRIPYTEGRAKADAKWVEVEEGHFVLR
ncbi:MAG: ABC transporter ATP-binding protein [Culicoidibacterales bacterium]